MTIEDVLENWAVLNEYGGFYHDDKGEMQLKDDAPEEAKEIFEAWAHPEPDEDGIVAIID